LVTIVATLDTEIRILPIQRSAMSKALLRVIVSLFGEVTVAMAVSPRRVPEKKVTQSENWSQVVVWGYEP